MTEGCLWLFPGPVVIIIGGQALQHLRCGLLALSLLQLVHLNSLLMSDNLGLLGQFYGHGTGPLVVNC